MKNSDEIDSSADDPKGHLDLLVFGLYIWPQIEDGTSLVLYSHFYFGTKRKILYKTILA